MESARGTVSVQSSMPVWLYTLQRRTMYWLSLPATLCHKPVAFPTNIHRKFFRWSLLFLDRNFCHIYGRTAVLYFVLYLYIIEDVFLMHPPSNWSCQSAKLAHFLSSMLVPLNYTIPAFSRRMYLRCSAHVAQFLVSQGCQFSVFWLTGCTV